MVNVRVPNTVKNVTIGIGNQPGTLTTISGSETTISGSRVTTYGLQLEESGTGTSSVTLSGTGNANGLDEYEAKWVFGSRTTHPDRRLFGDWHYSLYEDSVDPSTKIPGGSSVNADDYTVFVCPDWGTLPASDSLKLSELRLYVHIKNESASPKTVLRRTSVRYIVDEGSL